MLSAAEGFVGRTVGDSLAAVQLHDMIERVVLAQNENLAGRAGDIGRAFEVMTQEARDQPTAGQRLSAPIFPCCCC